MAKMSKNWVFTINNPTPNCETTLADMCDQAYALSMKAESEKGKGGTPHLQGAIEFERPVSKKVACRRLGGRAWTQYAYGTWEDQDYCLKDPVELPSGNTVSIVFGTGWIGAGNRTDIEEFRDAVLLEGKDDAAMFKDHLREMAKYPRLEGRLRAHKAKLASRPFRKVSVFVYFGKGGTGKSKRSMYNLDGTRRDGTYVVPKTDNCKWFQDYAGEQSVIFNDFYGGRMKFDRWLDICDGHQMMVETKGGHTYAEWTSVIFTSNTDPNEWYSFKSMADKEYARRFTRVWDMDNKCIKKY